ncbi:MAG: hypothetical protein M1820_006810 [Bogoriella megaspora]|nr:MAG: hypothetical protein M1820_006810 [Bogoriella megaspora]
MDGSLEPHTREATAPPLGGQTTLPLRKTAASPVAMPPPPNPSQSIQAEGLEQPQSPSFGAKASASSPAHVKGTMGPPHTKLSQNAIPESQEEVAETQFPEDGHRYNDDDLKASRPETPEEQTEMDTDPDEPLEALNWQELEDQYHHMIQDRDREEQQIMKDFESLTQVFAIWAQSGNDRENDRSFKRLKTQITHVQRDERLLEDKRQHYIQVVEAFKKADEYLYSDEATIFTGDERWPEEVQHYFDYTVKHATIRPLFKTLSQPPLKATTVQELKKAKQKMLSIKSLCQPHPARCGVM